MGMLDDFTFSALYAFAFFAYIKDTDAENLAAKSGTSIGTNTILVEAGMVALLPKSGRKRKRSMAREGSWENNSGRAKVQET